MLNQSLVVLWEDMVANYNVLNHIRLNRNRVSRGLPVLHLVTYTLILNISKLKINIIISMKDTQKISDTLYIRL